MVKIHWIDSPDPEPGRTYTMFLEGMRNNPRVERVGRHEDADWVFMHHMAYLLGATYDGPLEKLVVIDFRDRPNINVMPKGARAYFVRSWYESSLDKNGFFERVDRTPRWPDNFFPLSMCAMDDFFLADPPAERDIDVTCCLRNGMHNRRAVREELERYFDGKDYVTQFGPINKGGRNTANNEYLRTLARSKIVVTCQPDRWEGDWRTWEAFASGACVFSDFIYFRDEEGETDGEGKAPIAPEYVDYTPYGCWPGVVVSNEEEKHNRYFNAYQPLGEAVERLLNGMKRYGLSTSNIGERGKQCTRQQHMARHRIDAILWRLKELQA